MNSESNRQELAGVKSDQIQISEATAEEKQFLSNLMALYLHDLSGYCELVLNEQGLFEYDSLDVYYEKEELTPLLFKIQGEYAGFILLNRPPYAPADTDYCINEFFILRKYRGQGWAQAAVERLFQEYPGRYYIVQMTDNEPAVGFWHRVYENLELKFEEKEVTYDGIPCIYQKVESSR